MDLAPIVSTSVQQVSVYGALANPAIYGRNDVGKDDYNYADSSSVATRATFEFRITNDTFDFHKFDTPQIMSISALLSVTYQNLNSETRQITLMMMNPKQKKKIFGASNIEVEMAVRLNVVVV